MDINPINTLNTVVSNPIGIITDPLGTLTGGGGGNGNNGGGSKNGDIV
ncbi:hypothetical protein ACIPEN_02235 [Herbaspirillum chlorophenolicum]|uniref:Uncharacterized protein n=1 Tax=Herbaspirillum chlorophenolicum TaxID=211589 RepID=A0ABW8ET42_9BURK|nr:hypothetical protein [Herbaspirillum chlorophenolicum]